MRKITAIIDLKFGSTGKGLLAGYLAQNRQPDTIVTAWAANAGHTFIDAHGNKFVHTMLANGIVSPNLKRILIGPGSILDLDNLFREIMINQEYLQNVEIFVHENAAVITDKHRVEEANGMTAIGSTKKGCGAAAIQRIRRNPDDLNTVKELLKHHAVARHVNVVGPMGYAWQLDQGENIMLEGAQGYSLSMYHGFYPYTTSRDVSTAQLLADCGVPVSPGYPVEVIGTARTYPIRVANRFDHNGKQIGWSGPNYLDQAETSFEDIGQEIELTTVTKLPRRIFTFSLSQVKHAVRQCGVKEIFLNFCNYMQPDELKALIESINRNTGARVRWTGHGATVNDVVDVDAHPELF